MIETITMSPDIRPIANGCLVLLVFVNIAVDASLQNQFLFGILDTTLCNNNSPIVSYTKLPKTTDIECVTKCPTTEGCYHVMYCYDTKDCYIQDQAGLPLHITCSGLTCFDNSVLTNVALNAPCVASSEHSQNYRCHGAVDGIFNDTLYGGAWASLSEGAGIWITLDLGQPWVLTHARFMQRLRDFEQNEDIELLFSDGSKQQLPYRSGYVLFWDDVTLVPVLTSWVKVTVLSVYGKHNNGWTEIELYARSLKSDFTPGSLNQANP